MNLENSALSPEDSELLRAELRTGESLSWVGKPIPRLYTAKYRGLFVMGWIWTIGTSFFLRSEIRSTMEMSKMGYSNGFQLLDWANNLFPLLFVLAGIPMISSPFWFRRVARKTLYAVTNQRAILFDFGWGGCTVRSYEPAQLKALEVALKKNGEGDLIFEKQQVKDSDGCPTTKEVGFMAIANVREVENIVRRTMNIR